MTAPVQPDVNLIDESLSESRALSCRLCIEVSEKSVSLAVIDPAEQRYLALESFRNVPASQPSDFNRWMEQVSSSSQILAWHYLAKRVLITNRLYTLVPGPLFIAGHKEQYLTFNVSFDPQSHLAYADRLAGMDAYTVFAMPVWLRETIYEHFDPDELHHSISTLIESVINRFKYDTPDYQTFCNLHAGSFDLVILQGHRVIFCNTFPYRTPEDMLYYIMFVFEQQGLAPDLATIRIMGEIGRHAPVIDCLTSHVRQVDFIARSDSFLYTNPFEGIPGHYFYNLLNADQCEL